MPLPRVVEPDVARGGAVQRVTDVVHPPPVAVFPPVRHARRAAVVAPEVALQQFVARLLLKTIRSPCSIQQLQRVDERAE